MIPVPDVLRFVLREVKFAQESLQQWDESSPGVDAGHRSVLDFTLDGILMGDIGKALCERLFRIQLTNDTTQGFNALTEDPNPLLVDVFTTRQAGPRAGFSFRRVTARVLAVQFNSELDHYEIIYNGPGRPLAAKLEAVPNNENSWTVVGQKSITVSWLRRNQPGAEEQVLFRNP
jgi:hypothetical protein